MNPTLKREAEVVLHGQTVKFRLVKYLVILLILCLLYVSGGWTMVFAGLSVMVVTGLSIHLLFRWKTQAWTKPWWIYKTKV